MRPSVHVGRRLGVVLAAFIALTGCQSGPASRVKNDDPATQRDEAARIHTELGQKYLQQGKLEIALEKLNKALDFNPDYADAHTVIAVLYESIGDAANAELHYKRAAQLRPKAGAENNNYGRFLCARGQFAEAEEYFKRALADPFYQTPALAMGNSGACLVKAGKVAEAEDVLRKAVALNPNDAEALLALGEVAYGKGDYMNARAFVQRYEALAPARPDSLMLGRNVELRLGNAAGASEYSRKLIRTFPNSAEAKSLTAQG
jgi:type IV pilus assembly protein PilF